MFRNPLHMASSITIAAALGLICPSDAPAKKPPPPVPPEEPLTYRLVELSATSGSILSLNQLDVVVEMAGCLYDNAGEVSVAKAHYWMVAPAGDVLLSVELRTLPEAPGATVLSYAYDVNNHGVIVGYQANQGDGPSDARPLLWPDAAALPIELPLPDETVGAVATSINDAGIVVGYTYSQDFGPKLVAWKVTVADGEWVVQDTLALSTPGACAHPHPQIVNSGYVSATLDVPVVPDAVESRAFRLRLDCDATQVWQVPGSTTQLLDVWSTANGINEAGTVCGRRANPIPGYWGMSYAMTVSGESLDLAVLPAVKKKGIIFNETYNDDAFGLNNSKPIQIVGQGSRSFIQGTLQGSEKVPLRWDGETSVTDVRTVTEGSPDLHWLCDVNDAGWITAVTKGIDSMPELPAVLIPSR